MTNPLIAIMDWYKVALDSMRVTARVIRKDIKNAITNRHVLYHEPSKEQSLARIEVAEEELSNLVVLSLVATFERTLRDYAMERPGRIIVSDDPVDAAIHEAILNDIEYWRIADRLITLFQTHVTPEHLGHVKQIIGYRNWVAHGRSTPIPPDGKVIPKVAFEALSRFLSLAAIIDSP
jgi:hypothetical protein